MDLGYWFLEYELDQMSRYLEIVKAALQNYGEEIEAAYARDMANELTGDAIAFVEADYEDRFIEAGQDLPRLLLSSFIISWFSFVEQGLLDLCVQLKLSVTVRPKDRDYFDKGIRRARKFLYEAKGYEIDIIHWQELININRFRNYIVHTGSQIHCSFNKLSGQSVSYPYQEEELYIALEKSLFQYLQKHKMLGDIHPPSIEIMPTYDYCHFLINFGKELFYKLHNDTKPNAYIFRKGTTFQQLTGHTQI